jgi:hypothetical protein
MKLYNPVRSHFEGIYMISFSGSMPLGLDTCSPKVILPLSTEI